MLVCAYGLCSVAMVKPLLSVVLSVVLPWLTGVARLRVNDGLKGLMLRMARCALKPWFRLSASCREAREAIVKVFV